MSMWEIEALIEDSINLVGETAETNEEKTKLIGRSKQYGLHTIIQIMSPYMVPSLF